MLDGDKAGRDAEKHLRRSDDGKSKPIIDQRFVLNVTDWSENADLKIEAAVSVVEPEDLLPVPVALAAARAYARKMLGASAEKAEKINAESLRDSLQGAAKGRVWKAIEKVFKKAFPGEHIDKVGFAKEVIDFLDRERAGQPDGLEALEYNFFQLIAELSSRLDQAEAQESERRTRRQTNRAVRSFIRDHVDSASRDAASQLLREIESTLEESQGDERVQVELIALRREFELGVDPLAPVTDFERFRDRLRNLDALRRIGFREAAEETSSASASAG
jgi:hypothetical protein